MTTNDLYRNVGKNLKNLLYNMGLSQLEFSKKSNISSASVCNILKNKHPLRKSTVNKILQSLPNISLSELISDNPIKQNIRYNKDIAHKVIEELGGLYYVSEYGDVLSLKNNKYLLGDVDKDGYLTYRITSGIYYLRTKAHRLVAKYYLIDYDDSKEVNHIDFNKLNNHYSNLSMTTQLENIRHKSSRDNKKRYGIYKYNETFWVAQFRVSKNKITKKQYFKDPELAYKQFYDWYLEYHKVPPWIL